MPLTETTNGTRPVPTKLSAIRAVGAATITVDALTGWPIDGKKVHFIEYAVDTSNNKIPGSQTDWKGTITGATSIGSLELKAGTDNGGAVGYVIEAAPTAAWADELYEWGTTHADADTGALIPAAVQAALGITASPAGGWDLLNAGAGPNMVTPNGNGSYDLVFNGVNLTTAVSAGMRFRTTRSVAAPTQSANLNGTNQYFSKAAPAGMTFTDDFTIGAWVKLSSYAAGNQIIVSRRGSTQDGWDMAITSSGQIRIIGFNTTNWRQWTSYQSIPLNKWVHITAQLDMSSGTTTTNKIYINGISVPCALTSTGTPASLIQAGDLIVGNRTGGSDYFNGKIAQVFVSSMLIPETDVRAIYSQGLTPALITANNIISAYSLSGTLNDLNTTNANNLTANGGAVATNADSPFGGQADGTISSTLDYAIVQKTAFSTNTTVTVQVPEGCTIPTSGGVANVYYSNVKTPYNFPSSTKKWELETVLSNNSIVTGSIAGVWGPFTGSDFTIPAGVWKRRSAIKITGAATGASTFTLQTQWDTGTPAANLPNQHMFRANTATGFGSDTHRHIDTVESSTATVHRLYAAMTGGSGTQTAYTEAYGGVLVLENAYL